MPSHVPPIEQTCQWQMGRQAMTKKGLTMRMKNAKAEAHEWLMAMGRDGRHRIERLGWKRLASIYLAAKPGSAVRKAINADARRCGYTPRTIIALHAE